VFTKGANLLPDLRFRDGHFPSSLNSITYRGTSGVFYFINVSKIGSTIVHSEDGKLRYGDTIMLGHRLTDGTLASDLWDEVALGSNEYCVTGIF